MGGRTASELTGVISLLFLLEAASATAQLRSDSDEGRSVSVLGNRDPRLIRGVTRAVQEASRRLGSEECRRVFSDFADASGVGLAGKLEAANQDGKTYLAWLVFRNGSRDAYCDRGAVALASDPGSRFVVVCGVRFLKIQTADPGYAAALIIHEELHSLGLGENPPSSAEITARVVDRCGR
jgi:hypothetical protein